MIHHYCPHTFNAGDHFVIRSIRKHLSRYLPGAVYLPKPCAHNRGWNKPVRLTGPNVDFSNRYADAVIIGGSDQYKNWSLRLRKEEMKKLVPPLYLIGLGISSDREDGSIAMEKKRYYEDIRVANEISRASSVRDDVTLSFLESCGYEGAVVTGCPALYLYDEPFLLDPGGVAAVTFPFPLVRSKRSREYELLVKVLRHTLEKVAGLGFDPVIVCHDDRDVPAAQELFPEERLFFSNDVDLFLDFYEKASIIVGSRLHASILAAGMGVPFVNINLDIRGRAFTDTFGLEDWNVNLDDPDLIEKLMERIDALAENRLVPLHEFHRVKNTYRNTYDRFMKHVAHDIRACLPVANHGPGEDPA
jgi:hypothetical protein